MKKIKNFMLPEHTNSLYRDEAISSISLTIDVAAKINELVDAYNKLISIDYEREQEQDGRINKAVLFMKDNLLNSLEQLMDMLLESGFIDERIMAQCKDLNNRLDTLLGAIKPGNITSMDAEVIDGRTGILDNTFDTIGNAIREQLKHVLMVYSGAFKFTSQTIVAETGELHPNETRLLSSLLSLNGYKSLSCDALYNIRLFYYDVDLNYLGASNWGRNFELTEIDTNAVFIRFIVAKRDNDVISVDDLPLIKISLIKDSGTGRSVTPSDKYQYTDIEVFNGTITAGGTFDYRTNRLITKIMKADFTRIEVKDGYKLKIACYDSNMQVLTGNDFKAGALTVDDLLPGTEYMQVIIGNVNDADNLPLATDTGLTIYTNTKLINDTNPPEFIHELMNVAYSSINLGIANTKMHFDLSARFGFNALKGDVRISKDDKLFMWHDAALTTSSGMIYPYDPNSNTKIIDLDSNTLGAYTHLDRGNYLPMASQHLCTFEEYIQICVKHNKIAYITVRENKIPKVIKLCMETLKKYNMLERCVFNSYEYEALQEVRKYSSSIPVSLVIQHQTLISLTAIEKVACLGNGILTLFYAPIDNLEEMLLSSATLFNYAIEKGVVLHMAQVDKYDDYIKCINAGIKGFHLLRPLQEYQVKYQLKFKFENNEFKLINDDLTAELSDYAGEWGICNVRKINSELEYDDGLPLWLVMRNNPSLIVSTLDNNTANTQLYAYYDSTGGELCIVTGEYKGRFNLTLII